MNKLRAPLLLFPASIWFGLLCALIGASALFGLAIQSPPLVQIAPGLSVAIVAGTALCFIAAGAALILEGNGRPPVALQRGLSCVVLVVAGAALAENLFDIDLHVDLPDLHRWIEETTSHPGRMAPNTAIGFIACAIALILLHTPITRSRARWIRGLSVIPFLCGVTGLLGGYLSLDFLYDWHGISRMALPTAIGEVLLSFGLWETWRNSSWNAAAPLRPEEDRVSTMALVILAVVASTAGIVCFIVLQQRVESLITEDIARALEDRANFFSSTLDQYVDRAALVPTRPGIVLVYRQLAAHPNDVQALAQLSLVARSYLPHGFEALSLRDAQDKVLVSVGEFHPTSELDVALTAPFPAVLQWSDGFYLLADTPVVDGVTVIGRIRTQQPLWALTRSSIMATPWGETGEIGICATAPPSLHCFPSRFHPHAFIAQPMRDGHKLPMTFALAGQSGSAKIVDSRSKRVLAAYRPIGGTGLGMVMKIDLAEIYSPIRNRFEVIVGLLIVLVGAGALALRLRIRPILDQMATVRHEIARSESRFRAASETGLDAFFTLECVRNSIGEIDDFSLTYVNGNAERLLGQRREDVLGSLASVVFPEEIRTSWFDRYRRVVDTGRPIDAELQISFGSARSTWQHQHVVQLDDGIALTMRDIGEKKAAEERLAQMAQRDAVTGMPNRALLVDRLDRSMIRTRRSQSILAVMALNIDYFKKINEIHGHAVGDEVLRTFAARLAECVRGEDTVARTGSDEFAIVIEGAISRKPVYALAERILERIREDVVLTNERIRISTSVGITFFEGGTASSETLLKRAKVALAEVQQHGRDGYFSGESTEKEAGS